MRRALFVLGFLFLLALLKPSMALAVDCRSETIPRLSIFVSPVTFSRNDEVTVRIVSAPQAFRGQTFRFALVSTQGEGLSRQTAYLFNMTIDQSGNFTRTFTLANTAPSLAEGTYTFSIQQDFQPAPDQPFQVQVCNEPFSADFVLTVSGEVTCNEIGQSCTDGRPPCRTTYECDSVTNQWRLPVLEPIPIEGEEEVVPIESYNFCQQVPAGNQRDACLSCLGQEDVQDRIYTAVGCLRTSKTGLAGDLIRLGLGVGGGLALVSILAASFLYATSQGDQAKTKTARELATGAVSGLLFMIFSVIILNFVGVEILKIPGLAGGGAPVEQAAPQTQETPLTTTELLRIRPQLTPMFDGFRLEPNEPLEFCARSAERSAFDSQYGLSFSGTCIFGSNIGCEAPFPQTTALSPVRDSTGGQYEQCVTVSNVDLWSEGVIRDYLTEQLGAETVARLNITVVDTNNEAPGYQTYIVRVAPVDAASQQAWFSAYQQIVTLDPIVYSLRLHWQLSEDDTFAGSWQIRIDFDRSNFPAG